MTGLDADGLDDLARSVTAAAEALRLEAGRCTRALAGLQWSSGVGDQFVHIAAGAAGRAARAADEMDRLAGGLRQQGVAVREAVAAAARLAGDAVHDLAAAGHEVEQLAGDAWHLVGGLL